MPRPSLAWLAAAVVTVAACHGTDPASSSSASRLSAPGLGSFESGLDSPAGLPWVAVTDKLVGGVSTAQITVADDGAAGTRRSLSITGKVTLKDFPFPFAGAGLRLAENGDKKPTPVDVSGFQGIQFWSRGDGKQYVLKLMSPEVTDYNHHHFVFRTTATWEQHRVPFGALAQYTWGKRFPFSGKSLLLISFVNYSPPGDAPGDIALSVDEVSFY